MLIKEEKNVSLINIQKKINKNNETNTSDRKNKFDRSIIEKNLNIKSTYLNIQYFSLINIILFELILILLPKRILLDDPYIELKVKSKGYHQILSEKYSGLRPSAIYVNNEVQIMKDFKVYVESTQHKIRIEWLNKLTDFTYMFSNLSNITSVTMNKITGFMSNMSYMFYNCNNLQDFTYISHNYNCSYYIKDTIGMFYNCSSLKTFSFTNLYMDFLGNCSIDYQSVDYYRNMSYMFYNCQSLESIFSSNDILYVNDMRRMFYNCYSLSSFDITNFCSNNTNNNQYVDLSYMFYNCSLLSNFIFSDKNIYTKDMNNMFSNCKSLKSINLNRFKSDSNWFINMSRLFYNCHNLEQIEGNLEDIYISDAREMFFNCTSFKYINDNGNNSNYTQFNIKHDTNLKINMSKMFYNCHNLEEISIYGKDNYYIYPNDFNSMFYNCSSLKTVNLQYININHIQNLSYMFYNCKKLKNLFRNYFSYNSNSIIKRRTMKGMFQNCESLSYLDLSDNFYTTNVEIMWDMFKGCSSLESLNLSNFDTSLVTDMNSMFEGCYNLISLNLNNFNTHNVLYMNRMLYNCSSLKSLYFHNISSDSLGTMQHMFYNCSKLEYLDLYSLTEKAQSIAKIFQGASTNFTFCIEENEYIPNIFKLLLEMPETKRDCDFSCYYNNSRIAIPEKKLCCKFVEYNGNCYDKCPGRTKANDTSDYKKCENFSCDYYYNYEQDDCIDKLPLQYYVNDTKLKTIDKCHPDCETCSSKAIDSNNTNCLTCANLKYIYLGNCYSECKRGSYYNNTSKKEECYCFDERCIYCSDEFIKQGLCLECNNTAGYFQIENDTNPPFNCYKQLDKYYLDELDKVFKPCYMSCQTCNQSGIDSQHNCLSCNSEYPFALQKGNYFNCYSNCSYYFYFNISNNYTYTCTENFTCPVGYDLIAQDIGQCVKFCNETENYKYQFKNICYNKCPIDFEEDKNEKYTCFLSCPFERPFRLVSQDICVSTCTINERRDLECVTNYFGNRTNEEIQDIVLSDIEDHLISTKFNYTNINDEVYIINETKTFYELTSTNKNKPTRKGISYVDLAECETALRNFYNIFDGPLYILKFDIYIEGKEGPTVDYRVYYPLDDQSSLEPLDLVNCGEEQIFISFYIELDGDPAMYDRNSPYYNDICVSYSSNDGIDMTLEDRQNKYIENNKSLCEEDCTFVEYNTNTKLVKCACSVKFTVPSISEIKVDKDKLYKYIDLKKLANFDVLKCYKLITSKVGIITNFGFYLFIPTFIMYFVTIFLFYIKEFNLIKKQINDIAYAKNFQKYTSNQNKDEEIRKQKPKNKQIQIQMQTQIEGQIKKDYNFVQPIIIQVSNVLNLVPRTSLEIKPEQNNIIEERKVKDLINENNNTKKIEIKIKKEDLIESNSKEEETNNQSKIKEDKMNAPPIKGTNKILTKKIKRSPEISIGSSRYGLEFDKNELNLNTINNNVKGFNELTNEEKDRIKLIMKHNDSELNVLDYKDALKYDDRTYFQYYFSLLRTNHLIVKIISKTDYNSRIIKIFLCFFNFSLSFTVNTLFFSDDTMHKILEDGGKFNLIYQLPQIIYSSIISFIFDSILTFLALSEENVLSIKHEKIIKNVPIKVKETIRALQIKFVNFFIFSFIFFLGFWYYTSCFCAVYKNTQYHLIKDSLISYVTSLITPFIMYLFPGLFRIPGIKGKKEFLYLFSKIMQLF